MVDRYRRAPGGWCVELIHLTATSGNRDGEWLRVSYRGLWVADVRTPAESESAGFCDARCRMDASERW